MAENLMSKNKWLSLQERKEILEIFKLNVEEGVRTNCAEIARKYNVSNSTIVRMRNNRRQHWETTVDEVDSTVILNKRRKMSKISNLEEALYEWFKQKKTAGETISSSLLQEKALLINQKMNIDPEFKASKGWLSNFKDRYNISSITMQNEHQQSTTNYDSYVEFFDELTSIIRLRNFQIYQIYNADETGLYWKLMPRINSENKEEKFNRLSEERVTVMVCSNANGSHKIPLFIIGKSPSPSCFRDIKKLPVKYENQENALMTDELFKMWFTRIFIPSVEEFQRKERTSYKILLVLDNAKCHSCKEEIEKLSNICTVEFLPPNVTSLIQPMNQGIIENMKRFYRKNLLRDMLLEKDKESLSKYLEDLNMLNCCTQIATAWSEVSAANISRAWGKLIPNCAIDVETSDIGVDDILQFLYRLPGYREISIEDVLSWLQIDNEESGWKLQNIDQIVQGYCIIESSNKRQEEEEEEEEEEEQKKEIKQEFIEVKQELHEISNPENIVTEAEEALNGLKIFQNWYQRQWNCELENLLVLQRLNNETKDIVANLKTLYIVDNVNE